MSSTTAQFSQVLPTLQARRSWLLLLVRSPAEHAWSSSVVLALLCGWLFFYGLGKGELFRTESLRAIIAAQFLRSGNWVVPTLYGEPIFTKPPGMYAAIALLSWPFGGVSEWTARLPSALAATITVFLWYWYLGRQLGRRGGLLAAVLLPVSLMWLDKGSAAEIDMMQVAWVTAAILFFLRALEIAEEPKSREQPVVLSARVSAAGALWRAAGNNLHSPPPRGRGVGGEGDERPPAKAPHPRPLSPECRGEGRTIAAVHRLAVESAAQAIRPDQTRALWFWWLAALLCVAGGVLTKWTAPAFFYGTVVTLLWRRGRLGLLFGRYHLVSALVGAAVCLTWIGAAVALAGWEPFYNTVSREALMRLLPSHHDRPYPWRETLAHPAKLFAASLPFSVVALFSLRPGFGQLWDERGRRLLQALHCWLWPNLVFWTIIPEHAPRHSFPLFPAIAGLAAFVLLAWIDGRLAWPPAKWRWLHAGRPLPCLIAVMAIWLAVKLVHVHVVIPLRDQGREPTAKGQLLAQLVPEGNTLYLFMLKDEGIMFYYGRPVRRLAGPELLPSSNAPLYCILDNAEWHRWKRMDETEVLQQMLDEQGAPIVLVKLTAHQRNSLN
ncbi:MAG TPA: glycosyltransferase family 39 protein [Gemmataceae bacterium]|nr:glycosyltransferase family 39 protein [Gemmataceae bacterium]